MNELPPSIKITEQMLEYASLWEHNLHVRRTKTSKFDTKIGLLGEVAFAYWLSGDWKWHHPLKVRGQVDFFDLVEIKTSAFKFSPKLHLLVRQDYAVKRSPKYYLQLILDIDLEQTRVIEPNTDAYLCGYATHNDVVSSPLRDFGSKFGGRGGYRCHYIPISKLKPVDDIRAELEELSSSSD